ncbi:MAG: helix-turn-helix domain-containing protein [Paramuribaculum sp.]|nr:helix-turn-helix domain-containing protein [Paramuribaculum sp.]
MENDTIILDSIDAYNKLYGLSTYHPLVSVVDLKKAVKIVNNIRVTYGIYALFLKNGDYCTIRYGRKSYDYQAGTVTSFSPGQTIDVVMKDVEVAPDVVGLIFHPDLIYGTPLADKIADFNFFDYSQTEALHLSDEERAKFLDCLDKIREEVMHPVDNHSAALISANIQVMLEYLHRFYDRQFITRHRVNSDVVSKFERELKACFREPRTVIPNVAYFADKANLTPGYFSDLIKKETGSSPKDLISLHLVAEAKKKLMATNDDISVIAYNFGFEYPSHFTRMFKRLTGLTPLEYRRNNN